MKPKPAGAAELPPIGTVYHVSSSAGSDDGPGTESQPWKTLDKVSSMTFQAGDQILLKRGDVWTGEGLTLNGSGDHRKAWIILGAYGEGSKPRIMNPPYHPDESLIDWRSINKVFPGMNRIRLKVAVLIKGENWRVRDLEISHTEMGILVKNGMGYHFSGLYVHNVGFDDGGKPLLEHEGGSLIYPKYPRYEEIERETGAFPMWGDPSYPDPEWGNAIEVSGEKVTIENVVIEKATGGIHGWVAEGLVENVFIDKVTTGGLTISGADLKVRRATVLNAMWPSQRFAWFGVCVTMSAGDSSIEVTDSEIAYTGSADGGGDCCALEVDQSVSGVLWARNFIHHNAGAAVEFGMAGPNQLILVEDNVTYANGRQIGPDGPGAEFSGDASPYGARLVTIRNNRIYKATPGQYLNYYFGLYNPEKPSEGLANDWKFPEEKANYTIQGNAIHEAGTYALPLPAPEQLPEKINLAPKAKVSVSSGSKMARFANDGDFDTEWRAEDEGKPSITLKWDEPRTIDEIWFSDSKDLENWGVSGTLTFDDGDRMEITGGIFNNGAMRKISLDKPRTVRWLRYQVTRNVPESPGTGVGLGEILVFEHETSPGFSPPKVTPRIDFEERPDSPMLLRGERYGIDWKNADWTTRKDSDTGNHYLYVDFPGPSIGYPVPTWAIRLFTLPWGATVKSMKVACPEGAVVGISQQGQEGVFFPCPSKLTEHETGWIAANAKSNLIGFWINVEGAKKKDAPADLNDVWFDDIKIEEASAN